MPDNVATDELEGILPDFGLLADERPETAIAGLPSTLIVSALEDQLSRFASGYTDKDYLSPIINASKILASRHSDDNEITGSINVSIDSILDRVITCIEREWNVEFSQVGLDHGSAGYAQDVLELYRFFIVDRMHLSMELMFHMIVSNRKQLVEQYRKSIEKKNQTVSEARRVFQQFEDVVVWVAMPQIFDDLVNSSSWDYSLQESLDMLNVEYSQFLHTVASMWTPEEFAIKYCKPIIESENRSKAETTVRDWWITTAPKKVVGEEPEEEE